jgi:hypothetical protein
MTPLEWTMRVLEIRRCPYMATEEDIVKLGGKPEAKDIESVISLTDDYFMTLYSKPGPKEGEKSV